MKHKNNKDAALLVSSGKCHKNAQFWKACDDSGLHSDRTLSTEKHVLIQAYVPIRMLSTEKHVIIQANILIRMLSPEKHVTIQAFILNNAL